MQTTQSRQRDNLVATLRHGCWNPTSGSVLPKSEMSPARFSLTSATGCATYTAALGKQKAALQRGYICETGYFALRCC